MAGRASSVNIPKPPEIAIGGKEEPLLVSLKHFVLPILNARLEKRVNQLDRRFSIFLFGINLAVVVEQRAFAGRMTLELHEGLLALRQVPFSRRAVVEELPTVETAAGLIHRVAGIPPTPAIYQELVGVILREWQPEGCEDQPVRV